MVEWRRVFDTHQLLRSEQVRVPSPRSLGSRQDLLGNQVNCGPGVAAADLLQRAPRSMSSFSKFVCPDGPDQGTTWVVPTQPAYSKSLAHVWCAT